MKRVNNKLIHGDSLVKLREIESESIDLVYLDPPFFTQRKHALRDSDNKQYSFDDAWDNIDDYIKFIRDRLIECKRCLKCTGSIFLHCDRNASHYLRQALDEVFGMGNFQSEIIWTYRRWSNPKKGLLNAHQNIYFYSKTKDFKFNKTYTEYSPTTNIDQIFQRRKRDSNGKATYEIDENGAVELQKQKKGVPLSDVWEIPYLNPKAKERVGYPTQKPILLLERIISLVTDAKDVVLDPFCGSGTTLVAAKILNRNYIGIDTNKEAIKLSKKRIEKPVKTESDLLKKGKKAYKNQTEEISVLLSSLSATPVQRNKGIDGFIKIDNKTAPIPIRIQRNSETINQAKKALLDAVEKNEFKHRVLVIRHQKKQSKLFDQEQDDEVIIIDAS